MVLMGEWREREFKPEQCGRHLDEGRGTNLKIGEGTWKEVPCLPPPQISMSPQIPREF